MGSLKAGHCALLLFALSGTLGCRRRSSPTRPVASVAPAAPQLPIAASASVEDVRDRFEIIPNLSWCEVEHEGTVLDLGGPMASAYRGFGAAQREDSENVERDGQTFVRAYGRALRYDFWLDEPRVGTSVSVRAYGGAAKWLGVSIDDKRVGAVKLVPGETRVVTLPALAAELGRGHHRLKFSFSGAGRGPRRAQAELDWVRIGERGMDVAGYAAPTLSDIVGDVVLDGTPKRSLVLRSPSTVRCWLRPAPDARLRVALGFWGAGKGTAEVRVVSDGEAPVVLQTRHVTGGDSATWTPLAVDLRAFAGKVVGIEFRALSGSREGRVAFGDPSVTRKLPPALAIPRAKLAILLIDASIERGRVPPFGPMGKLLALGALGRVGTAFSGYRAPSVVVQSVATSLLAGLSPRSHRVEDSNSRIADSVRLLSEMVKEGNGRTAMFTGVPTTFAAFGFNAGWDTFDMVSPVLDLPATEPLTRGMKWLDSELDDGHVGPRLLVLYTRGAHPPWDISRDEAQALKPDEYSGILDPRRGGVLLAALRARRRRSVHHLQESDWVRLHAFEDAALVRQDAALEQLESLLKRKGVWDQTLLVFMGDVAVGDPPDMPFDPQGALSEERLAVPLVVKFPGGDLAGRNEPIPVGAPDVTATILTSLGLPVPAYIDGADLYAAAHGRVPVATLPLIATTPGRFATRFGSWLLRGELGRVPTLCETDIDPACVNDVFEQRPYAARALWFATFRGERRAERSSARSKDAVPAVLDPETIAALTVWGDIR